MLPFDRLRVSGHPHNPPGLPFTCDNSHHPHGLCEENGEKSRPCRPLHAIAGLLCQAHPHQHTERHSAVTPTPSATATAAAPSCQEAPPFQRPVNDRPRIDGHVGATVALDSQLLADGPQADQSYGWSQVFGSADDLDYITGHVAEITGRTAAQANFVPAAPGNYRFELAVIDAQGARQSHEVDVLVTGEALNPLKAKGVIFADIFGEMGAPQFNSAPEDPDCLAKALDHALAAPTRVHAGWIGLASSAFLTHVDPPVVGDGGNYLSLTDEAYYRAMVKAAHDRGLKVLQVDGHTSGLELTPDQLELLPVKQADPDWWDAWFAEWKRWTVSRAERAERHGVEMFAPLQFAEDTFRPDVFPEYGERWRDILSTVRDVYSGTIAMSFVNADDKLNFIDAFDVGLITVFDGMYITTGIIEDVSNPTMDELLEDNRFFFSFPQALIAAEKPIYYVLTVNSADAQRRSEDIDERITMSVDFQEQVLYYEAFFKAVDESPWISGVFTERWDWFDQFARPVDPPGASYFDATLESSPRSKPAEDVVKLWYSME